MAPLLIDLHQMVDLALITPHSGAVNLTVLHALLHVIVRHLDIPYHRVEFRGEGNQNIEHLIPTIPVADAISVTEYSIADPDRLEQRTTITSNRASSIIKTILSVSVPAEYTNDNRIPPGFPLVPLAVPTDSDLQTIKCNEISMHDMLAVTLPCDHDLLVNAQQTPPESLTVMWSMINLSKRVDAVEVSLQRFAELLHQLDLLRSKKEVSHASKRKKGATEEGKHLTYATNVTADRDGETEGKTMPKSRHVKKKQTEKKDDAHHSPDESDKHHSKPKTKSTKHHNDYNKDLSLNASKSTNFSEHLNNSDASYESSEFGTYEGQSDYSQSGVMSIFQNEILLNQKTEILAAQNERINDMAATVNAQLDALRSALTENFTGQHMKFHSIFIQTMQEVQDMLDAKVDKLCIPPLKQYIADELMAFSKRLDWFAHEFGIIPDAAGTRTIRNLTCISCQLPANQRDREKHLLPAMDRSRPLKSIAAEKSKHRNCGGSNTVTTANERMIQRSLMETHESIQKLEYISNRGEDGVMYQSAVAVRCPCQHK